MKYRDARSWNGMPELGLEGARIKTRGIFQTEQMSQTSHYPTNQAPTRYRYNFPLNYEKFKAKAANMTKLGPD